MDRIMVIDDEGQVRKVMRRMLERAGYEVEDAYGGDAALKKCRKTPCDIVITDIIMPGKDGFDTMRDFAREFPAVKIIVMSGGGRSGYANIPAVARELGALEVLEKPVDRADLLTAVKNISGAL